MVWKNLKAGQVEGSQVEPVNTEGKSDTSAIQDLLDTLRLGFWRPKKKAPSDSDKDIGISELNPAEAEEAVSGNQQNLEGNDVGELEGEILYKDETNNETDNESIVEDTQEIADIAFEQVKDSELKRFSVRKGFRSKIIIILVLIFLSLLGNKVYAFITEPKPPSEDVVAAFSGKYLTKEELSNYISSKGFKEEEHGLCEKHGFDHKKCDKTEACETHPIHSLEGYRQIISMIAVQKIVDDWAKEKGITQKSEVKHDFKHLVEEVNLDQLVDKVHKDQLSPEKIDKWEIQKYYDANKDKYKDKPFSEVEGEIRNSLAAEKDKNFFPEYIEQLKKNAALNVNYALLKVVDPTEAELKSFYEKNKEKYLEPKKVKILEIKVDISGSEDEGRKKIDEALTKIRSGERFEDVALTYSSSKQLEAYYLKPGEKWTDFEDEIFNLQVNELSAVFKAGNSFYIVKVIEKQDKRQKTFGEVLNEVKVEVIKEKEDKQYELRKNEALFSIHGKTFTLGEFATEFKELSPETQSKITGYEAKKSLIDQLIAKELLLEETGDDVADKNKSKEIEELKSQYIQQILHKEEIDEKLGEISDEEARKLYDEKKSFLVDPPKAKISLVRIGQGTSEAEKNRARQRIDEALQKLKGGSDFAAVAKEYSNDPTASVGGELNEWIVDDSHLDPILKKIIFNLQVNQISNDFEYKGGYYVVKLLKKEDRKQKTFDESKELLKKALIDEKHLTMESALEDKLLKKAQLVIYNSSLKRMLKEDISTTK
ncbi:peptidyl-prolyl cis-trans isomerase [Desulfosporosinus metallidurans]|uniref:peptidylprolyl isomerase n=1 Tax=Desulfosporosinus metallidurans TaxID=1888891 RepID=A0A1Q8QG11_9FIRM|nr:peptidyl-prolyl cis-trans isomerase [Desulfosporosinus metallidurans]OLN26255.1 Peptidyl-prolyl cis-trans isomerase PpiD [Desulfosporosinus metallidurans]